MGGHWTDTFSFTTGAVRTPEIAYLAATEDKAARKGVAHSALITWVKGKWGQGVEPWGCVNVCVVKKPKVQAIYVGERGHVQVVGSGEEHSEQLKADDRTTKRSGFIRKVRAIKGTAYAAGFDRQVYRRDAANVWTAIDGGMRAPEDSEDVVGFEGIDGFTQKDIYAAGYGGEIWHYNGRGWRQEDSPTDRIISNLCCGGDGNVYLVGRRGLLIRGRKGRWEVVKQDTTKQDLWGVAWFQDRLYLASQRQLFSLAKGDTLEKVRTGDDPAGTAYHLSTAEGVMWSIGAKDVMAFDGKTWTRID